MDIGLFFQNVGRFQSAIDYYQLSQKHFGESDVVLFNIGMCFYSLDRHAEAIENLQAAYALNAEAMDAKEWIEIITKEK